MKDLFNRKTVIAGLTALAFLPMGVALAADEDSDVDVDVEYTKSGVNTMDESYTQTKVSNVNVNSDGLSHSQVDSEQQSLLNVTDNDRTENEAQLDANAFENAAGNIGANVAAGTGNAQANDVAISSAQDAGFVFASEAEANVVQTSALNPTSNDGTDNDAWIADQAFQNASGNLNVNVAAGTGNLQKNSMSLSAASNGNLSEADARTLQLVAANPVDNDRGGPADIVSTNNHAELDDLAFQNATGNIGVNLASGTGNLQSNTLSVSSVGF